MSVIGLTGGIASGKSTLSQYAKEKGAHIIDADLLGHRAYEPGTECFQAVVQEFGQDIVAANGTIDRKILGGKVFAEGSSLTRLTDIVWPAIKTMAQQEIELSQRLSPQRLIVLEAAVLIEAEWQDIVDEVWVVVVEEEIAIERAMSRDGLDRDSVLARIRSQVSNEERIKFADVVIDNSRDQSVLVEQIENEFAALAERRKVA